MKNLLLLITFLITNLLIAQDADELNDSGQKTELIICYQIKILPNIENMSYDV